jgi:peptide/nickel transport system permease protein
MTAHAANPMWSSLAAAFRANKTSWAGLVLLIVIILAAIAAPLIAPADPTEQDILRSLEPPGTAGALLGTDSFGRDVLSRILHGAQISLVVGLASILVAALVGGSLGIIAGYFGGRTDRLIMGAMDVLLAFPTLLLGLMMVAMLGPSLRNLIIAIALTETAPFARIARAPTLLLREREFVEAGRALGFSNMRLMFVHILPNVVSDLVVIGTLWMAAAIRTEASLSFIGLGVPPPTATWGGMVREGFEHILDGPWLAVMPSIAILLTVVALNMLGDGLRDAIDPRLRRE